MVDTKMERHFSSYVGFEQSDPGSTFCIIQFDATTGLFLASYEYGGPDSYEQFLVTPEELMAKLMENYSQPNIDKEKFLSDMDYIFPSPAHQSLVIDLPVGAEAHVEDGRVIITVHKPIQENPYSHILRSHLCDGAWDNLGDTKQQYTMRLTSFGLELKDTN